ncbi:site-specific integrase [Yersinia frederiksenii]|uniref:tyrosine-type recombinase/integrase n=1 Tax=Yersinia frederiksenii TaxID=29484 RepID=UPI0025AADF94|nr:site-specific integrase [Yersinia frederiksenii]MDN0117857.1 site-specific integrase [Yersinia frederiksenii]
MLTDTQCRTAKPKEKLYRLNDFNGLYLEVKPNGKKAWRYRFKLDGKYSMFALGEYPTVKLAEAREKCEQARKQVADGVNPTQASPAEATEAEWTEFDLGNALWIIPAARMKARREHVIPLPSQAIQMLRTLHGLTGHRQHLFPGRDNPRGPMTSHSLRQHLKSLGWSGTFSPHATRTTGSTRLNEMGYRPDAIEAQLAHADTNNVRRTYNHATYLDERKIMMQEWADSLDVWIHDCLPLLSVRSPFLRR